jgi:SAM-dependent methyltransferase
MHEKLKASIHKYLPEPRFTRLRNNKIFSWMNKNAIGKKVLNLGSGIGAFDDLLDNRINSVNLDINPAKPKISIIADAHQLPFKDGVFDIVYCIAVLEHVRKPWIVADEVHRVLKSGGHIVLELPFLNVIHDEHDYFRFTDKGIRSLFDEKRFNSIFEQVGSGGGSFLSVFLLSYFEQFLWLPIRPIFRLVFRYFCSLIKYLDVFVDKSKTLRLTANSFSFIGKKV